MDDLLAVVRVADNIVISLSRWNDNINYRSPPGHTILAASEETVVGEEYVAPQDVPLLLQKRIKLIATADQFRSREEAGYAFTYNGQPRTAEIDPAGIRIVMAVFLRAKAQRLSDYLASVNYDDGIDPVVWAPLPYRAREGYVALSVKQAWELGLGAFTRVAQLMGRRGQLELGILAASDQAALDLINPAAGWPS